MNILKTIIYPFAISVFFCNTKTAPAAGHQKITITNFSAYEKDDKLIIDWATDGKVPTCYWQVQASEGKGEFSTIAIVLGPDPRQQGDRYQYVEKIKNRGEEKRYFRLRHIDLNWNEQISEIIKPAK